MKYYFLASGSGGNATALVNDNNEILLIDCGIAITDIKSRLNQVGLDFNDVKKVLITHMHIDHVKSLRAFDPSNVYLNVVNEMHEYNQFDYYEKLNILGFNIYTLPASHDSPGTTGFLIEYNNEKMVYLTDGHLSNQDCSYVLGNVMGPKTKEVVFLHRSQEANTEDMVMHTFVSTMQKMNIDISNIKVNIAKQNEVVVCGKQYEPVNN